MGQNSDSQQPNHAVFSTSPATERQDKKPQTMSRKAKTAVPAVPVQKVTTLSTQVKDSVQQGRGMSAVHTVKAITVLHIVQTSGKGSLHSAAGMLGITSCVSPVLKHTSAVIVS